VLALDFRDGHRPGEDIVLRVGGIGCPELAIYVSANGVVITHTLEEMQALGLPDAWQPLTDGFWIDN
jgi:hypothetical protein